MNESAVYAIVGASIAAFAVLVVIAIALVVLEIIAYWKIFTKAGEKGWKSIIPFYNGYTMYKLTWNTKFFWIMLILAVAGSIIKEVLSGVATGSAAQLILAIVLIIVGVAMAAIMIKSYFCLAKAFGHGCGFTIGLIFFNTIFVLILAFGKSQYVGNSTIAENNVAE